MGGARAAAWHTSAQHEKTSPSYLEPQAQKHARILAPHEQARRASRPLSSSTKTALAADSQLNKTAPRSPEWLRLTKQFRAIQRTGRWARRGALAIGAVPNRLPRCRIGLRVKRGVKSAVFRNRMKRRLRAVCQRHNLRLAAGFDLIVVFTSHQAVSSSRIEADFVGACKTLHLLTP